MSTAEDRLIAELLGVEPIYLCSLPNGICQKCVGISCFADPQGLISRIIRSTSFFCLICARRQPFPAFSTDDAAALEVLKMLAQRGILCQVELVDNQARILLWRPLPNRRFDKKKLIVSGIGNSLAPAFKNAATGRVCTKCGYSTLWEKGIDNLWSCPKCHRRTNGTSRIRPALEKALKGEDDE